MRYALLVLLFATACENPISYRRLCGPKEAEEVSSFVLDCAKAANPMSDEEGEDLVAECARVAEKIFCPIVEGSWRGGWVPCSIRAIPECGQRRAVKKDP